MSSRLTSVHYRATVKNAMLSQGNHTMSHYSVMDYCDLDDSWAGN